MIFNVCDDQAQITLSPDKRHLAPDFDQLNAKVDQVSGLRSHRRVGAAVGGNLQAATSWGFPSKIWPSILFCKRYEKPKKNTN
jgi:hypothetical protein